MLVAGLLSAAFLHHPDKTEYVTAKVLRGEIRDTVDATGTVNAVITVQVGSQVSGTIARLDADFNSRVHKGRGDRASSTPSSSRGAWRKPRPTSPTPAPA